MFREFFLRCYRSFSRNLIVSLLPLAMPIVFLLLFLDATGTAANAPSLRIGVASSVASSPIVDALTETGVVRFNELAEGAEKGPIDGRKNDAILMASADAPGQVELIVRKGFAPWAELIVADIRKGTPVATAPQTASSGIRIKEQEVSNNDYLSFILPGLFVMVLIQLAMTSTASVVLGDRADGTFRMVASVKGAIVPLISAEILFRLIFAMSCYGFMMLAVGQSTDGWLEGRILPFTAVFALGSMMMIAFGYTLGGILPGRRNWTAVITLLGLAFWFFSDILFQASQHELARPLSLLLPPTYLTDALRQIATGKPGTFPLYVDISVMASILILSSLISFRFFRYDTNDDRL